MKEIIFIVDNLSLPRCIKRVKSFADQGVPVKVYGYDRGASHGNQAKLDIPVIVLRHLNDGKDYFSKLKCIKDDVKRVIAENSRDNCIFYSFGFIASLMLSRLGVKYIYEISDVRYASYNKFAPFISLFKAVDKGIIKKSYATVMTSGGFKDFFCLDKKEIFVIPNKVSTFWANFKRDTIKPEGNKIRFAFVGLIRYASIFSFAKVIGQNYPEYTFDFYGSPSKEIDNSYIENLKKFNNVHFNGPFKNPEDLANIYEKIDIVVSCYDIKTLNERIAEPNKLYESMFFCRPIVVSKDIFLAKQVEHYGCGFEIDATNEDSINQFINGITTDDLKVISERELAIHSSELIDNTSDIINYIKE